MKLAWFEPAGMQSACSSLEQRDLAKAEPAFQERLAQAPGDLAAWIGLLQADPTYRDSHLEQLREVVSREPSTDNVFKLGSLELFCAGHDFDPNCGTQGQPQKQSELELQASAIADLDAVYLRTHDALTGLLLKSAYPTILTIPLSASRKIATAADMLRYLGGEEAYDVYMAAKINQWIGATPSAPAIDVNRLRIYKALIEELKQQYAESGHYNITTVKRGLNTTTVMVKAPPTPLELAARRFFDDWIAGITTAIDAQYR